MTTAVPARNAQTFPKSISTPGFELTAAMTKRTSFTPDAKDGEDKPKEMNGVVFTYLGGEFTVWNNDHIRDAFVPGGVALLRAVRMSNHKKSFVFEWELVAVDGEAV